MDGPKPTTRSRSPLSSPIEAEPSALQSHLYRSGLLQSVLSDIQLSCFGRVYKLHRIILGQSGFFRSLLDGGFSEASGSNTVKLHLAQPMTRKAFEFCLARLYGGGPALVQPVWARTERDMPFSLPLELLNSSPGSERTHYLQTTLEEWKRQAADQPAERATPDFLLSLLATAMYLEISDLQATAFQMIQKTLTPWTVGRYLRFALGENDALDDALDQACSGLETVARPISTIPEEEEDDDDIQEGGAAFLGPYSESIGQACAIWLLKWAVDVLPFEEAQARQALSYEKMGVPALSLWRDLPASWVRMIISSDALFLPGDFGASEVTRYTLAKRVVELRRAALSPAATSAAVASEPVDGSKETNSSTLTSEIELEEGDEAEYAQLFDHGIHFSHLVRPLSPRVVCLRTF